MNLLLPCVSPELSLVFGWLLLLVCCSHWDYFFLGFPPSTLPCRVLPICQHAQRHGLPAPCLLHLHSPVYSSGPEALESILDTDGSRLLISIVTPFLALQLTYPTTCLTSYLPCKFGSVQSLTCVQLFATPWTAACQVSLSMTNSWCLLKLMSIKSVMPSNHLILCHPISSHLQSFPASGSFPVSVLCIKWPKDWNFSFSISPSNEYSGLISFRMDWLDLLDDGKFLLSCSVKMLNFIDLFSNLKLAFSVLLMCMCV